MDSRRGGCCIARYDNGGYANDRSKMNRILLSYRPIAPKPAFGGPTFKTAAEEFEVRDGRGRRNAMKNDFGNKNGKNNTSNNNSSRKRKAPVDHPPALVTLQLLPESPDWKDSLAIQSSSESLEVEAPARLSFSNNINKNDGYGGERNDGGFLHMFESQMITQSVTYNRDSTIRRVVSSWVKVESIAYTWLGEPPCWLGISDDEKVMSLQRDTCPGFISDGENRVSWVNISYIEMFGGGGLGAEVVVCLVLGDGMELGKLNGGFTCRVRVVTCREGLGKKVSSITLPCDVWRMDFGGFAWRLDTKVALSLST